jgi:Tol biopolymer transport system component
MSTDGTNIKKLTNIKKSLFSPVWSPDGKNIAFSSSSDIYVMDAEGTNPINLTIFSTLFSNEEIVSNSAWSPSGKQLSFMLAPKKQNFFENSSAKLYSINIDGTDMKELAHSIPTFVHPKVTWSSTGTKIGFNDSGLSSQSIQSNNLYVVDPYGRNFRKLTSISGLNNPIWSPDGKKIMFAGGNTLYAIDDNGLEQRQLIDMPRNEGTDPLKFSLESIDDLSFSPDGSKIIFSYGGIVSDRQIYEANSDGSNLQKLTNGSSNSAPYWSPNGAKIVFVSKRDGNSEIYVMNTNGSEVQRLTNNSAEDSSPVWSPFPQ